MKRILKINLKNENKFFKTKTAKILNIKTILLVNRKKQFPQNTINSCQNNINCQLNNMLADFWDI